MFHQESWLKNSVKYDREHKRKVLRKLVKVLLRKGRWDDLPRKLPARRPDDGT